MDTPFSHLLFMRTPAPVSATPSKYLDAKGKSLSAILKKYGLKKDEVCFVGDDLVDVPALKRAGLAVAVSNSCIEAKKAAHYVTKKKGGKGAVREIIEIILRAQGKWHKVTAGFLE